MFQVRAELLILGHYADIEDIDLRPTSYLPNSTVNMSLVDSRPALCIQEMNLNQQSPLHQSHEFIVTCLAVGGPDMEFRWYKDDYLVEPGLADRYMNAVVKDIRAVGPGLRERASVLTITKAREYDSGVFRCVPLFPLNISGIYREGKFNNTKYIAVPSLHLYRSKVSLVSGVFYLRKSWLEYRQAG